jgi:S-DNA-T family DNA segregation ATPase FtsK/SpoIIIE
MFLELFIMSKSKLNSKNKEAKSKSFSFGLNLQDERIPKILGLVSILVSVYLFIAFTSYLFTWQEDNNCRNWSDLFNFDYEASNWLGRLGAILSYQFFFNAFGISSYILDILLLITGLSLISFNGFDKRLITMYQKGAIALVWTSVIAAFIRHLIDDDFPWGGAFGFNTIHFLHAIVGNVGIIFVVLFVFFVALVWNKNPNFNAWTSNVVKESLKPKSVWDSISFYFKDLFSLSNNSKNKKNIVKNHDDFIEDEIVDEISESEFVEPAVQNNQKPVQALKPNFKESLEKELLIENENHTDTEIDSPPVQNNDKEWSDDSINTSDPNKLEDLDTIEEDFEIEISDENADDELAITQENENHREPYDPTAELSRYQNPGLDLLEHYDDTTPVIDRAELEANKDQIIETLLNYKIEIISIKATIGPTVTLYEIVPAPGVRISKIKNLEDDIALSLAALGIRIIAPIPGKGTIGIEVPNRNKQIVSLREILASPKFTQAKMDLPIALGKTISNEVFVVDLAKMPHLLIAGATGQGKSVGINTVIMSLLYKKHPSQLKLILIDPKKVELSPYNDIASHYLAFLPDETEAIVTETSRVVQTLYSLTVEMDERYTLLKKAGTRNITEYNEKFVNRKLNPENGHRFLPYMVLIVDEFADLIMTAGKEVELPIGRLAQLARAVGIHLIIATQRPSVNIITGVIKANFPARLAFKVASKIDSRTILDAGGADQLIGRGDMLLSTGSNLLRIQCAFVDTPEVERVIEHISSQPGYPQPYFLPSYDDNSSGESGSSGDKLNQVLSEMDEHFEDAARLVVINQSGSTSLIQRRLKLGYNRSGRIMDQLEYAGIVGANEGSKARQVLFADEIELEDYLKILKEKKNKLKYS